MLLPLSNPAAPPDHAPLTLSRNVNLTFRTHTPTRTCTNQQQRTTSLQHPLPPFTAETALKKTKAAEAAWNTRDPVKVSAAYTPDTVWRNRDEIFAGEFNCCCRPTRTAVHPICCPPAVKYGGTPLVLQKLIGLCVLGIKRLEGKSYIPP